MRLCDSHVKIKIVSYRIFYYTCYDFEDQIIFENTLLNLIL